MEAPILTFSVPFVMQMVPGEPAALQIAGLRTYQALFKRSRKFGGFSDFRFPLDDQLARSD